MSYALPPHQEGQAARARYRRRRTDLLALPARQPCREAEPGQDGVLGRIKRATQPAVVCLLNTMSQGQIEAQGRLAVNSIAKSRMMERLLLIWMSALQPLQLKPCKCWMPMSRQRPYVVDVDEQVCGHGQSLGGEVERGRRAGGGHVGGQLQHRLVHEHVGVHDAPARHTTPRQASVGHARIQLSNPPPP